MVSRFAAALKNLGVASGDRVGFVMPNLVQTVVGMFGAFRVGALAVPNNPLYTDRRLEHQLSDSGCEIVICLDTLVPRLMQMRRRTGVTKIILSRSAITSHSSTQAALSVRQENLI